MIRFTGIQVRTQEVQTVMTHLFGPKWIAAVLLYGAGLRLMECLQLRVKDIDFGSRQITVRGDGVSVVRPTCSQPESSRLSPTGLGRSPRHLSCSSPKHHPSSTQGIQFKKSFTLHLAFSRETRPIQPLFKIPLMAPKTR